MNPSRPIRHKGSSGFTMTEVLISMSIVTLVLGMSMSTFMFVMRSMYKDNERLATNASLRYFIAQVSQKTLDASEFYIFPNYYTIDGSVNLATDVTTSTTTSYGVDIYHGDCLVLVTRINLEETSPIRRFCIYYRVTTSNNTQSPIRFYERTYGATSTQTDVATVLNTVNLRENPLITGSTQIAKRAIGRPSNTAKTTFYPIFSSEFPTISKTNENVSLNVEIINGTSANNILSSSSFNYTISPRR